MGKISYTVEHPEDMYLGTRMRLNITYNPDTQMWDRPGVSSVPKKPDSVIYQDSEGYWHVED